MRIGHGYDVHILTENRKLIIGGVEIPYEKGLLGHSDADVLLHAVSDSLLGAAALGRRDALAGEDVVDLADGHDVAPGGREAVEHSVARRDE